MKDILYYYKSNSDFNHYVEGYCRKHEIDVETALTHRPVLDAYEYYKEAGKGKISVSNIVAGCGAASGGDCK